jgi:hypothetical protein
MVVGATINHYEVVEKLECRVAPLLNDKGATVRCLPETKAAGAASSAEAGER